MIRDLRWAVRWLRRNPLFAAAVVSILGLGIGANTAAFSIADAVILRPLPYAHGARLVRVEETSTETGSLRHAGQRLSALERPHGSVPNLRTFRKGHGDAERDRDTGPSVPAADPGPAVFAARCACGGGPRAYGSGRRLTAVAVIGDRLWDRVFHRDPRIVGRQVTISDQIYTIVGVMPPAFEFPVSDVELWVPLRLTPTETRVQVVASMRPGQPSGGDSKRDAHRGPPNGEEEPVEKAGLDIVVSPWRDEVTRKYELSLVFIMAAVGLVLPIACADAGSLLLCRALQRQKEIAIRASLGAGVWRVVRQLLAESLVLAVLGTVAGMAVAQLDAAAAGSATGGAADRSSSSSGRGAERTGVPVQYGFVPGAGLRSEPAAGVSGREGRPANRIADRPGGRSVPSSTRIFSLLIAGEAAFAFLLLAGSGLMMRSLIRLEESDHGFRPDHVLTMRVPIGTLTQPRPTGKYDNKPRQMAHYQELVERLQQIPGVRYAAIVNNPPLSSVNTTTEFATAEGAGKQLPPAPSAKNISRPWGFRCLRGGYSRRRTNRRTRPLSASSISAWRARCFRIGTRWIRCFGPGCEVDANRGSGEGRAQMSYERPAEDELYIPYRQYIFGVSCRRSW